MDTFDARRATEARPTELSSFVVAHGGRQIEIVGPASDSSFAIARIESETEYDVPTSDYCGRWVVDIGAGYGEFAARAHLAGASLVVGFEPNPFVFPYLLDNLARYSGIEVNPLGVFSESGSSKLYFRRSGTASGSISEVQYDPTSELAKTRICEAIDLVSIEDVLARFVGSRGVLKVDAEGSEYEIVRKIFDASLERALETVVVEYHAGVQGLVSRFAAGGFSVRVVEKSRDMGLVYASIRRSEYGD